MRDDGISVDSEAPDQSPQITEEERNANQWRIYRIGFGVYVFAAPGRTVSGGTYHAAAASHEAAQNAIAQFARDEIFKGEGRPPGGPRRGEKPAHVRKRRIERAREALSSKPRGRQKSSESAYPCGHPRTLENSYGEGTRARCATCQRASARRRWHARKEVNRDTPKGDTP